MGNLFPVPPPLWRRVYMRLFRWSVKVRSWTSSREETIIASWKSPWTGWAFISVFTCLAIWWSIRLPHSGYGVLFIALLAALMQARTPGHWENLFLILLIGVFAVIEGRGIRNDHRIADQQRKADIKADSERFKELLDTEKKSFSDLFTGLIDHENSNMKQMLGEQTKDFQAMIAEMTSSRKDQTREFSSVIEQQKSVLQRQEELYALSTGTLLPGNDPTPKTQCEDVKPTDTLVQTGDVWWDISDLPFTAVVSKGLTVKLDRGLAGSILLAVDMRWDDGRIIAKIDKNTYLINSAFDILQYRDKNSLRLMDQAGKDLLSVRYLNGQTLTITGGFRRSGQWQKIGLGFVGCIRVSGNGTGLTIGE